MSELDYETIQSLVNKATDAMENAYAPYSKFTVGAAILFDDGHVATGCNIENASFGATICAERTAISAGMADGHGKVKAVCVTNATETHITPCGICRQVIYEFGQDVPVICCSKSGSYEVHSISELLPHAFTL